MVYIFIFGFKENIYNAISYIRDISLQRKYSSLHIMIYWMIIFYAKKK